MKYGQFVTKTIVHPTIEIDCQDGTHEYVIPPPEGGWKIGRFETRTVVHPTIHLDARPGIRFLVDIEAGVNIEAKSVVKLYKALNEFTLERIGRALRKDESSRIAGPDSEMGV